MLIITMRKWNDFPSSFLNGGNDDAERPILDWLLHVVGLAMALKYHQGWRHEVQLRPPQMIELAVALMTDCRRRGWCTGQEGQTTLRSYCPVVCL